MFSILPALQLLIVTKVFAGGWHCFCGATTAIIDGWDIKRLLLLLLGVEDNQYDRTRTKQLHETSLLDCLPPPQQARCRIRYGSSSCLEKCSFTTVMKEPGRNGAFQTGKDHTAARPIQAVALSADIAVHVRSETIFRHDFVAGEN